MANNNKKVKWIVPTTVFGIIAIVVFIYLFGLTKPPGCFRFDDGTTQKWTLDQLYDTNSKPPAKVKTAIPGNPPTYQTYTPFALANHKNIALEAGTGLFLVTDKNVKSTDIYLESPDLSSDSNWQGVNGYSLDLRREFYSPCFDLPKSYFAQLSMIIVPKFDNKEHLIAETDSTGNFMFHEMKLNTPYSLKWTWGNITVDGKVLTHSDYTIKKLRVRFTMPGYLEKGECFYRGGWKIGNVCPVK